MLTIRLSRTGKKKQPSYRLIVSEKTKDPWGRYLELLGNFNPRSKELNLKRERILHWVSQGAQMSNTVHNLLLKAGVVEGKKKKAIKISKTRQGKIDKAKGDQKAKQEAVAAEAAKPKEAIAEPEVKEETPTPEATA